MNTSRSVQGWLNIDRTVPGDSGNYSCVPSYSTPDWVLVHIIKGQRQKLSLQKLTFSKWKKRIRDCFSILKNEIIAFRSKNQHFLIVLDFWYFELWNQTVENFEGMLQCNQLFFNLQLETFSNFENIKSRKERPWIKM